LVADVRGQGRAGVMLVCFRHRSATRTHRRPFNPNSLVPSLSSANIQFPCELLALAYSKQGEALLEGFNFFKIQNVSMVPDRGPLFVPHLSSKQAIRFVAERHPLLRG
jgi:hypothetical protein